MKFILCALVASLLVLFFAVIRNDWVFFVRQKMLNENEQAYRTFPDYNTMVFKFWVWDVNKFIGKIMNKCQCGSFAINDNKHGRQPGVDLDLCDVCYWRKRAEQPEREPLKQGEIIMEFNNTLDLMDGTLTTFIKGVRFAEKHHGITK